MESLKIAQISTAVYPLPPQNYAGIEQIVYDLTNELVNMGHDVKAFAPSGSYDKVIPTIAPSLMNDERGAFEASRGFFDSSLLDAKSKFDIVHDHSHLKYIYTHPNANNMNLCSTLHNQVNFNAPAPVKHMNLIGISSWQSLQASSVLGIPVQYVHNGINLDNYTYNEDKTDKFLFLSRMSKFKGAHEAIALAKRLHVPLDVAGEDIFVNDPPYVHSVMSSCTGNVTYHGTIDNVMKESLLSNTRALILPLLWDEPFGLVAVEALASGTPVITMNKGAMPEIVEDGVSGFICNTIPEMEEALKHIDDIKPSDCVKRASEFTVTTMAEGYVDLYKQILNGDEW